MKSLSDWLLAGWYLAGGGWKALLASVVDVSLVAFAIYRLILFAKRSRAWQILWGLGIFVILGFLSELAELHTISFLIRSSLPLLPVAIVILFYPELRHALEEMGRVVGWGGRGFSTLAKKDISDIIREVARAASRMSEQRTGALMVLERETGLDEIVATGSPIEAMVTTDLLCTVFHPGGPLHDGAVIIRGNRVLAAGCTLPLSESVHIGTMIHTRHKAALGVTEESDAAVVVVSEETGTISLSHEGRLQRGLNEESLTKSLYGVFGVVEQPRRSPLARTVDGALRRKARGRRGT